MYRWVYTNTDVHMTRIAQGTEIEFHYTGAKFLHFIEIVHININGDNLKCML